MKIKTEILIKSTPEKIWKILTETSRYSSWNPFIKSIIGELKIGNIIQVEIQPPGAKSMVFKPKILIFNKNKELKWLGKLLFKGIFDGEHTFKIIDNKNGTSSFIQSENFKGILVPLFKNQLKNNTTKGFELMNKKLKELVEKI